ncbi:MAG: ABC transporter permease [Balneolaceae bacterium]
MNMNKPIPPKLAEKLLIFFLRDDLAEEVTGDLEEKFYLQIEKKSVFLAKLNYWYQVINYIRPFAIQDKQSQSSIHIDMFQNYFKIAWRNLLREKMYSTIKIGGFALGIAACFLIALFIRDELSYDTQYVEGDRIYRVIENYDFPDESGKHVWFPAPLAEVLVQDFPEIEQSVRFNFGRLFGAGDNEFRVSDQQRTNHESGFVFADKDILEIFELPLVFGESEQALSQTNSIVLTKRKADKYFPNQNPVGKTVLISNISEDPFTIGGVIENLPENTHLSFDFLITMEGREFWPGEQTFWRANNYHTYIKVRQSTNPIELAAKIKSVLYDYMVPAFQETGRIGIEERIEAVNFELQPVSEIHLYSSEIEDALSHGDIRFVWMFGGIAGFILIIASINFVNLSTAKSANRAVEVGLRKTVGSFRSNLISQFLTESFVYSLVAFIVGLFLAWALLPYFNVLADKTLAIPWLEWWLIPSIIGSIIIVGLLSGIYPSFYLSSFKPIQVLKGSISSGSKSSGLRSTLVIFQFTTSLVLIIGTLIIYRQTDYILNKQLGFNKDQVIVVDGAQSLGTNIETFKEELTKLAEVSSVSISDYLPVSESKRNGNNFWKIGTVEEKDPASGQMWRIDHDYLPTMGIELSEGRNFSREIASDSQAVLINEKMIADLELENPIGKEITNSGEIWTVIGVVEDFHFESLREDISGIAMAMGGEHGTISIKVSSNEVSSVIPMITNIWNSFSPNQIIRYSFLDQRFAVMYNDVLRMGIILTSFAIFAILVACLGLFALSAFMVEQRSKEISIRLVLGASLSSIFNLLTFNFLRLILISLFISVPISWYIMDKWLTDFEYRIGIGWDIFLIAGICTALVALFTISYQSIKAGLMNPVESLKS